MSRLIYAVSALCIAAAPSALNAQYVFAEPGSSSVGTNVFVYAAQPLSNVTSFPAGAGTFLVLAKPDGTAYYAIANSRTQAVTVTGNTFATAQSAGSFNQPPTWAALTPNGRLLLVAAGTLHIIDTGTNSETVAGGVNVGANANVIDVAPALDGSSIFTLSTLNGGGSQLNSIDPTTYRVTGTLSILGTATALAVGPNGLVYVSTQNEIVEVNPTTLQTTTNGIISLNALPGRPVFTPDGLYMLAPNQTPNTGSSVLLISIANHALANFVPNFAFFDRLVVINASTFLGFSSQLRSITQFTLSGTNIVPSGFTLPNVNTNINAIAVSDEVGGGLVSTPKSLYAISGGNIYQYTFATASIAGQFNILDTNSTGALSYAAAASSGASPVQFLTYGGNQTILPSGTSLPIVFLALDSTSRPVSGASVTFTSNAGGTFSPATVTTGANGYALTYFSAPAASGPVVITGSSGALSATVNLTVGTPNTGGGPSGSSITILSGQGLMVKAGSSTATQNAPIVVQVTDGSGNPVGGVAVTFAVNAGTGSLQSNTNYAASTVLGSVSNSLIVTTDANGKAAIDFQGPVSVSGSGFDQTTVLINAPGTATVTLYAITASSLGFGQAPAPNAYLISPQPGATISGQSGQILKGAAVVRISSGTGIAIPNVAVSLSNGGLDPKAFPSATCVVAGGGTLLTDSTGTATCDMQLGAVLGTTTITPQVGVIYTSTPSFLISVAAGPPGIVKILQGNNQSGNTGQQLSQALVVQVTDVSGNILSGQPVTWQVVTGGTVNLSNVITTTDTNGRASALATLGNIAGIAQVKVTAGTVSATFSLTVNVAAAGMQKVSGDSQSTLINSAFGSPIVVQVVDKNGGPVNGVGVNFAVTSGSATLGTPSVTTGTNGQASTTVAASSTAGSIVVTATSSGFSVTFTLTAVLPGPANVTFVNGASFQAGLSPGVIALVTGASIASNVQGLVTSFSILGPLPTTLAGVSITFNGVAAPIYYIQNAGNQQTVAVQVPFETQPGTATVVINAGGGGSGTFNTQIQPLAPAVFTTGNQGLSVVVRSDGTYVSAGNPAQRGEIVQMYVTGLGQVGPTPASTGSAGIPGQSVTAQLLIGLNNAGIPYQSANYAPGLVGVYVVTFQIPSNTQPGPSQPVGVLIFDAAGNQYFAPSTFIPIS